MHFSRFFESEYGVDVVRNHVVVQNNRIQLTIRGKPIENIYLQRIMNAKTRNSRFANEFFVFTFSPIIRFVYLPLVRRRPIQKLE